MSVNPYKIINFVLCNVKNKKDFSIRKYGATFLYSAQRKTQISCKFQFSYVKLTCVDSSEKGVECKSLLSNTQVVWDDGPCGLLDSHWISKKSNSFSLKVKWTPNLTLPQQQQYMFVLASLWHVHVLMSVLCCDTVQVHATEATVLDTLTACDDVMAGSSRMSRSRLK